MNSKNSVSQLNYLIDELTNENFDINEFDDQVLEEILHNIDNEIFERLIRSLTPDVIPMLFQYINYSHHFMEFITKIIYIISLKEDDIIRFLNSFDCNPFLITFNDIILSNSNEDFINRIFIIIGNFLLCDEFLPQIILQLKQSNLLESLILYETNNPLILSNKAWLLSIMLYIKDIFDENVLIQKTWELTQFPNDEICYNSLKALYNSSFSKQNIKELLFNERSSIYETATNDNYKLRKISILIISSFIDDNKNLFENDQEIHELLFNCIAIDKGKAAAIAIGIIEKLMNENDYEQICSNDFINIIVKSDFVLKSAFLRFLALINPVFKISNIVLKYPDFFNLIDDFINSYDPELLYSCIIILGKLAEENDQNILSALQDFLQENQTNILNTIDEYEIPEIFFPFQSYIHSIENILST